MKLYYTYRLICYLFIFLGLSDFELGAQLVSLPQGCKYKIGDDLTWADPSYNDHGWENKQLGSSIDLTGMKEDVYAWFRIRMVIPSSMKISSEKTNGIQLNLGKIDDVDQTFLNGKLIGKTGSFPPNYESKSQINRLYLIPENMIKWDMENIIAVRLFSPDVFGAGMYQGPYNFGPVQWSDFISIQQTISETEKWGFTSTIQFTNLRDESFDGTINYWIANKKNRKIFTETKPIHIKATKGSIEEVELSNYIPIDDNIFKLGYLIKENTSTAFVTKEQLYLADKHLKISVTPSPKPIIENKIRDVFTSGQLKNQQQRGYLSTRMKQNMVERILKIDVPGTLDGYLERPGHHPWAGEHIGKYLETASNIWKNTGNEQLKMQMDMMMYQLINSQQYDGYLGTYLPDDYWTSWDVWSHKYNLYGLLAYYSATGYQPALEACKKMGNLLCRTFGNKKDQRDIIKAGTHMGMAATSVLDPMVELYKYTGDKKYLDFCYYILGAWEQNNGPKIISSLLASGKVNKVGNGKAYEMLSNFVGLVNLYRVTGDEKFLKPVIIAWNDIVSKRLYITGTTSSHEYFQEEADLPAGKEANMGEGCVTTTWIQLNQQLLAITGDLKFFDQIEKSIYNHLLAAENPKTGCVSYYTPLMDKKPYTCYITCCQSSVPRGIAMIPYFTFGKVKNVPTLMVYEPADYQAVITKSQNKKIQLNFNVKTDFPVNGEVVIQVNVSESAIFPIALRVPVWCTNFVASVGSKTYSLSTNGYLEINRLWKYGEKIKISFKMPIQVLNGNKSYPGQIAFQRGPQVLAFDETMNSEFLKNNRLDFTPKRMIKISEGISNEPTLEKQWVGKQTYQFEISETKEKITLVPFADASQTGGVMKVWLPFNIFEK